MSFISMEFLLFVLLAVVGYYLIPKKWQWIWLLLFSYAFYMSAGLKIVCYLLFTTITTYTAGILLNKIAEQPKDKIIIKKTKKRLIVMTLFLNFGMLALLKYANFAIDNVNLLFDGNFAHRNLLLPLGISFYTFQSMGYILDVYWGKYKAEKNPFRFALFVSFFPQLLQGPIGRFDRLAHQFFEEHRFDITRVQYGIQLMLWGYFKKLVIADRAATVVNKVFSEYTNYTGMTVVIAVLLYSVQLYADFSGGMDVVIGIAEMFGIRLDQNFKRPYFATSITDFWHRWHITLGTWMKDYIFYPLSLSKGMGKFGKWTKKVFGKKTGRVIPVAFANIVVFLVVGIWHGAAWKYIAYGLYNGLIIAISNLIAPLYVKGIKICHINVKSKSWKVVQMIRTFTLVNISWYFDMAVSLSAAFIMMKNTTINFSFRTLTDGSLLTLGLDKKDYVILFAGCLVWFVISVLQEKGLSIRASIAAKPLVIRWGLYMMLLFGIPAFGYVMITTGGFIYAQF
ncbi:MAG: MBOAT family protein [Lachnospiraceae bacterium]|nr:MBOAT family protein [Lachnospiraceae bacterium]